MREEPRDQVRGKPLAVLCLAALGVVYGDIGTSPLYALRECFHGAYGVAASPANVLGVVSLMVWTLLVIVSAKYLTFILCADHQGEGGVMALTAQLLQRDGAPSTRALVMIGLFAAALLYGDGMITPAISVLSAVEGVGVVAPALQSWLEEITVIILVGLFLLQRRGTRSVGVLFGPITALWFIVIAMLGLRGMLACPQILAAMNPLHASAFLQRNGAHGFVVLGAVFLAVTGAEALYADMGHFGRRPIRLAWYGLVLPSLLLNYFGQGALLMIEPEQAYHPFYSLAPSWALIPLVVLATAATIIASQAVISGAFSLTHQAIALGYLPRLHVVHTSATQKGQVYLPQVNWTLMLATVGLVLGFHSSSQLAAAYGVAVTATMTITSLLFFFVARARFRWSPWLLGPLVALFLAVDISFLGANLSKIGHGAWFSLAIASGVFAVMTTWKKGRALLAERLYVGHTSLDELASQLVSDPPCRVPGKAVFMAGSAGVVPPALAQTLKHNKALQREIAVVTIKTDQIPRVPRDEKVDVRRLEANLWCVTARWGYLEQPNVPYLLALAREKGLDFQLEEVTFFLGRERIVPDRRPVMALWREALFAFLSLNAVSATKHFRIPPEQVIEIGTQVEL